MDETDLSRREALTKLGKFAAYTAPAMMVLLTAEKAMARSNEGDHGKGGNDNGKGHHDNGNGHKDGGGRKDKKSKKSKHGGDNC
jgi:hypothetical protein